MLDKLTGRTPGLMDDNRYKKFAVLVPFLPESREILFEVRSANLERQPGEICLPGGYIERGEEPQHAAVRETCEELLISRSQIEVLAPLDLMITPFYAAIHPFAANLKGYKGSYSSDEVAEVFTAPLDFFLSCEPLVYYNEIKVQPGKEPFPYELLGIESYPWGRASSPVLFYTYESRVIWGLTAKIIYHLVGLLKE